MSTSREIRLQKVIADCGITSRRKAEEMILEGRVKVNGLITDTLGTKVDPSKDAIQVDGQAIDLSQVQKLYIVLHKPRGVVTTVTDPEGRPTVMDYCKTISERIYPVGRLDYLSEGLLILTNDGDLTHKVTHPSFDITKVYEVKVFGAVTEPILKTLRAGVQLEEGFVKPKSVRVIKQLPNKTWLEFRLCDGKNREIRRLCEACGVIVDKLKRVAIENLTIDGIAPGKYQYFTKREIYKLMGMDVEGRKLNNRKEYFSAKKSINLKLKGPKTGLKATDESFKGFSKEKYFSTLKSIKERKKLMLEKAKAQAKRSY